MTIIHASNLAEEGAEILSILQEMCTEVRNFNFEDPKKTGFEDRDHLNEYMRDSLDMVMDNLRKIAERLG